jgi:L-ribulose-5-phosphate 4-epimerase
MIGAELRELVCRANRQLAGSGLVHGTFGNVSGVDHDAGIMVIKPSGVDYAELTPAHMVAVSLETGAVLEATLRPSSDAPTHVELYRAFRCGGIVHTHSEAATTLAQARVPLRCMGTTHADHFRGDVPVTRPLGDAEIAGEYERNTGLVIVEAFRSAGLSPEDVRAVLVASHGPFVWAGDPCAAVELAQVLELLARMEITRRLIAPETPPPGACLVDKHYFRKHGAAAYYGQKRP